MEVDMRSIKSGVMVVAALLVCLSGTAGAATVQVKVPFPFQLHGLEWVTRLAIQRDMPIQSYRDLEAGSWEWISWSTSTS